MVAVGQTLGSYELIDRLGRGGMGEVWLARHRLLDRPTAVKVIRASALGDTPEVVATLVKRFAREAQATSRLSSPHTVQVHDFGTTDDGSFYYVMELLDGVDLESLVRAHGPLPPARVVHLLGQVCESLAEAHRSGLVHRDIKPANLYLCRLGIRVDFVKVLDFGLVKSLDTVKGETQLTSLGAAAGSPAFMAPELVLGDAVDARADLYALGAVAFWLLTGRLVFDEKNAVRTLMAHVDRPPEPPSRHAPGPIPAALDALVLACLAKAPADRPASVEALAALLHAVPQSAPWGESVAQAWWRDHMPPPREHVTSALVSDHGDTAPDAPVVQRSNDVPPSEKAVPSLVANAAPAVQQARPVPPAPPAPRPPAASPAPQPQSAAVADLGASRVPRPRQGPLLAERDRAVERLQDAFGQGDLTMSEYDERLELAERARNQLELEVVMRDLPATVDPAPPAAAPTPNVPAVVADPRPAPLPALVAAAEAKRSMRLFALFSGSQRKGPWVVPAKMKVRAVFGGVELDFRRAQFTTDIVEVQCHAVFGGVNVIVPPDVYVEVTGTGIFGAFVQDGAAESATARRVLRVSGLALFGGVNVEVRDLEPAKGRLGLKKG